MLGNLSSRADANENLNETFTYDALDRLISSTVNFNPTPLVKTFTYGPTGNLLTKSDVGTYSYPAAGSPRPHAVTSIAGATISTTFAYDANGNQTAGLGRTIGYTSFNKPASIAQGTSTLGFFHDPEHQRFKQTAPEGTTVYLDAFGVHVEYFVAGTNQWNEYLIVGGRLIGVRFERSDNTVSTRYFVNDHLGSVAVLTDENALVVERLSYDAWGKRRFPNGADDPAGSITSQTSRGFTGQEELADVGLVHLNGRVYDPLIGRMMTADPFVPDPTNGQAWNRYSYVINNPLSFTDPNGYCFLGLCSVFNAIGSFFRAIFQNPLQILQIAVSAICAATIACAPFLPLVAAASAAFVAGVTTGRLDLALRAGFIAGATAIAFNAIGDITLGPEHLMPDFLSPRHFANIAGHALVGCLSSVASGGKCQSGAAAAAAGAAGAPLISEVFPHSKTDGGDLMGGTAASAALGGLASVAGGGKFGNGAVTGAFGYLFNAAAGCMRDPDPRACSVADAGSGGGGGASRGNVDLGQGLSSAVQRAFNTIEEWLGGSGIRTIEGGSDLILQNADGTRQVRFDIENAGDDAPHINLETFTPRNAYPGDTRMIRDQNEHVYLRADP